MLGREEEAGWLEYKKIPFPPSCEMPRETHELEMAYLYNLRSWR